MFLNDRDYLDQHFLIDKDVINKYINFCDFKATDEVLEIGPGIGTLTKLIAPKVSIMYAIELDTRLKEYLDKIDNLQVIYGNVLDVDIPKVNKIITSLPYSIIEPFMYKFSNIEFDSMYMLMGSTYINNVLNKNINKLAIFTNCYFKMEKLMDVDPSCFDYPPRTMSSIVKITKIDSNMLDSKYKIYRELFYRSDKKIKNGLLEVFIRLYGYTKRESKEKINNLGLSEDLLNKEFRNYSNEDIKLLDKVIDNIK